MVRRRIAAVSNHEASSIETRAKGALLWMRVGTDAREIARCCG
jgi:hypothetical protein